MKSLDAKYDTWSREDLIERLMQLERPETVPIPKKKESREYLQAQAQAQVASSSTSRIEEKLATTTTTTIAAPPRTLPPSKSTKPLSFPFPCRKIALKFCYSGWEYGGLAYQNVHTPLPTVEGVIFDALAKARLIEPKGGLDGCGWEKCGRTDRGVSAAGQVISLWVKTALGGSGGSEEEGVKESKRESSVEREPGTSGKAQASDVDDEGGSSLLGEEFGALDLDDEDPTPSTKTTTTAPAKPKTEHDYIAILNRLLPPTIRILAWSPVSEDFSARFACTYRHYKYFFSADGLDIEKMRNAAARLVGGHDFRNLCKLDPAKQITIFQRRILKAEIVPLALSGGEEGMYVLNLIGTAFLYHQVRHIMAVLFLVGSGLEHPSVVNSLMNIEKGMESGKEGDPSLQVVSTKPEYQMADALPLMLWECGYPEGLLDWRTSPDSTATTEDVLTNASREGSGSDLYHQMYSIHSRSRIYTTLDQHFLHAALHHHPPPQKPVFPLKEGGRLPAKLTVNVPLGGGTYKRTAKYVDMLNRNRMDDVSVVNERWRLGKGARREERKKGMEEDDGDE